MVEPKKLIRDLYRFPPELTGRTKETIRLDRNECTISFPAGHLRKILNSIKHGEITAYPQLEPFYKKLSKWLKVDRDQVILTAGSDTAIKAVFEVYVSEGDEVVLFPPTYGMYPVYCDMFGAKKREVFYDDDFSLPVQRALGAINQKTKLVAIPNPNHTGTVFKERELAEILKKAKKHNAVVLIDEAYHHFYEGTMLPYIDKFDNLIVIRTFSKAFGIAPLRIGYAVSNRDNIANLYKVKLTHEITAVSARFGEYLLDHPGIMKDYARGVRGGIKYLSKEFKKLGISCPTSYANFIYLRLPLGIDPDLVVKLLKEKNYHIRGLASSGPIKGHVRITVGPMPQMRKFMRVFKAVFNKAKHETDIRKFRP